MHRARVVVVVFVVVVRHGAVGAWIRLLLLLLLDIVPLPVLVGFGRFQTRSSDTTVLRRVHEGTRIQAHGSELSRPGIRGGRFAVCRVVGLADKGGRFVVEMRIQRSAVGESRKDRIDCMGRKTGSAQSARRERAGDSRLTVGRVARPDPHLVRHRRLACVVGLRVRILLLDLAVHTRLRFVRRGPRGTRGLGFGMDRDVRVWD